MAAPQAKHTRAHRRRSSSLSHTLGLVLRMVCPLCKQRCPDSVRLAPQGHGQVAEAVESRRIGSAPAGSCTAPSRCACAADAGEMRRSVRATAASRGSSAVQDAAAPAQRVRRARSSCHACPSAGEEIARAAPCVLRAPEAAAPGPTRAPHTRDPREELRAARGAPSSGQRREKGKEAREKGAGVPPLLCALQRTQRRRCGARTLPSRARGCVWHAPQPWTPQLNFS
ncbi:hypothetical protein FA09DRAFT_261264 [Tilletiopsis washingtonensis]|uniref:Uncharacterized protein n=1 Tax=Tilletiopsis washingtonensis TaxID=58919 RepID=A0A316ZBS0_9BASI|nr:hypothetical protein FA09DRAFT_261264 [Tilletiopsis washingtonensis]PWN98382.1 hypothetical protein FA09DRAFT_261264 [Tilletiopsis washingtonensis]